MSSLLFYYRSRAQPFVLFFVPHLSEKPGWTGPSLLWKLSTLPPTALNVRVF